MARLVCAEIVYYAKLEGTGEIFESSDFRQVFNSVRLSLRGEIAYSWDFAYVLVPIHYGLVKHYSDNSFVHESLKTVCYVEVYGYHKHIISTEVLKGD